MKILIIGGTGLISTAIARKLIERDHNVTLFNRGNSTIPGLEEAARLQGDRYHPQSFVNQIREAGTFDCVIDMICYQPVDAESLVAAVGNRTAHLLFCSTVDVYAKPASRYPVVEAEPRHPVSAYGRGKSRSEEIVMQACQEQILPATIIRPAHTYGPGGTHRGNFVHAFGSSTGFLDRLRRGKPVVVPGDGSALRGSSHLEDVSQAFVNAVGRPDTIGRAYHVTAEEWLTWNRYHELLADALGGPTPTLIHIPTDLLARIAPKRAIRCPENYQFNGIYDNAAARRDLGFRYSIPFAEGARQTLRWVEENGGFENSDQDAFYDEVLQAWDESSSRLASGLRDRER